MSRKSARAAAVQMVFENMLGGDGGEDDGGDGDGEQSDD